MIAPEIDQREIDSFRDSMALYLQLNQRDVAELVAKKGNDLRIALFRAFAAQAPARGTSLAEARARGWRVKRGGGGLSANALKRADAIMQGATSITASSVRERKGQLRIFGFRPRNPNQTRRRSGIILNRRAVAVVEEINLRERARRSAAVGWLAGRSQLPRARNGTTLLAHENNQTGTRLGTTSYSARDLAAEASFTNYAHGAGVVANRGAVANALAAATADLNTYIARKLKGTLMESGVAK